MPDKSAIIAGISAPFIIVLLLITGVLGVSAGAQLTPGSLIEAATSRQTLFVDGSDPACDNATGAPAYCTIQAAVDDAGAGDLIRVAAGAYTENVLIPSGSDLTIAGDDASSTIVDGGDVERVFRIFSSSTVTLTRLGVTNGNFSLGGGVYAVQADVRIERSLLYANTAANAGGGLFAVDSDITIQNSAVFDNSAVDDGGGVAVEGEGALMVRDSSVRANEANRGGGIYALDTSLDLRDSEVTDNTAVTGGGVFRNKGYLGAFDSLIQGNVATTGTGGGIATDDDATADTLLELYNVRVLSNTADSHGGGVYLGTGPSKSLTLQDSDINYNVTAGDGGGINVEEGHLTISDSVLYRNVAADDGGGGYLYSAAADATVQNSFIGGNEAGDDGGGLFAGATAGTALDIDRSLIYDNRAGGEGGALFSDRTDLTQSTVYSNTATLGGGVFVGDHFSGYNSTLSGNLSSEQGGGLFADGYLNLNAMTIVSNTAAAGGGVQFDSAAGADVQKSLIANNAATSNDGPDCRAVSNSAISLGYNVIGIGNGCGGGFLDGQNGDQVGSFGAPLDPHILPLADNGGYSLPGNEVVFLDGAVPTHALTADSLAVDVIPVPTHCGADQTDQRGILRPGQDGNGDGGGDGDGCDVGALERLGTQGVYLPFVRR